MTTTTHDRRSNPAVATVTTTVENFYNALKNANRFRDHGDRSIISGVRLYVLRGNLVVEATDRYVVAQIIVERDYSGSNIDVIINDTGVRRILRQFSRRMDREGMLTISKEWNSNTLWVSQQQPGFRKSFEVVEASGEWPQLDGLVANAKANPYKPAATVAESPDGQSLAQAAFNPTYLWSIAGVTDYRKQPDGIGSVYIQPGDPGKPVFFALGVDDVTWLQGAIMPMRQPDAQVDTF